MLKRTITGVVLILIAIPVCIFSDTWIFPAVVAFLSFTGTLEMLSCIGVKKKWFVSVPLLAVSAAVPLLVRIIDGMADSSDTARGEFLSVFCSIMFFLMIYLLAVHVFYMRRVNIYDVSTAFVTTVYIVMGFSSILLLRYEPHGVYYFLVPVAAPFLCDIFAYLIGRKFGKKKLIPTISPNKTVAGSLGGTLFCTFFCTVYGIILRNFFDHTDVIPVWSFAVGGAMIAVISQIGDLVASSIKRTNGIKDYGKIFPGHGGVMDRFDSVIPTAPLFLVIVIIVDVLF